MLPENAVYWHLFSVSQTINSVERFVHLLTDGEE